MFHYNLISPYSVIHITLKLILVLYYALYNTRDKKPIWSNKENIDIQRMTLNPLNKKKWYKHIFLQKTIAICYFFNLITCFVFEYKHPAFFCCYDIKCCGKDLLFFQNLLRDLRPINSTENWFDKQKIVITYNLKIYIWYWNIRFY